MPHQHPLYDSVATSHVNTFKRWQDAHANLVPILADYLNACACLERDLSQPTIQSDPPKLAYALSCVDDSLPSLDLGATQLQNAQKTLKHLRNRSKIITPINALPVEILARISIFAKSCVLDAAVSHKNPSRFTIGSISSVCSHWRKVALETSSLWCHIDLSVAQFQDASLTFYAVESLKRAGSLPLHVHIKGGLETGLKHSHVIESLALYAHRIVSLDLEIGIATAESIVRHLFSTNYEGTVREFYLRDEDSETLDSIAEYGSSLNGYFSEGFLSHLTTLHLCGPLPRTPSRVFQGGLTELLIKPCDGFSWSYSELDCALSSCPKLRSLALIGLVLDKENFDGRRIIFKELEVLDLRWNEFEHICLVCSWIDTGSNVLSLSLSIYDTRPADDLFKLQPFIKRSHVARLCIDTDYSRAEDMKGLFSFLKDSLPLIKELAFQGYRYGSYYKELPPLQADDFPCMHTLHLIDFRMSLSAIQKALSSSSIQKVRFMSSRLERLAEFRSDLCASEIAPSITFVQFPIVAKGNPLLEWPLDL